ncbi:MAG: NADH-quinone oxidoreductase subunit J [Planctomycetota bacterium]|nr:NADH-quinone oxidoreductase subunit J [Planctomycetota bacterium]
MSPAAHILFWFVMVMTVASAALVVVAKKILHAAFALSICFLGVSGIYVFLHADFLAAVQLIVYVGGIIVLIMFAIMFSSHTQEAGGEGGRHYLALGAGAATALIVFTSVLMMVGKLNQPLAEQNNRAYEAYQHTVGITAADLAAEPQRLGLGHMLMGEYLLPFEVASILVLAALLGAVVIVRKETKG